MTTRRWTLILMAMLGVVASLIYALSGPAEQRQETGAAPALAALPLHLPTPEPVGATAASAGLTSPRPSHSAAPTPPALRVGSEGYGPHIERAQAGNDAQAAWEAVQWLRNCFANDASRNSFEHARAQGVVPELMTQLMVEADAEARRCQTVTAQHRALLPELAARAMRAGVPEAASAYANSTFPTDLTPAQRQEVADAMRRDAQAGHAQSLLGALTANEAWGLNDAEKLVYLSAYITLPGHAETQAMAKSLMEQGTIRFKTPPTPEQLAVAKPAVLQILERARAGGQP